MADRTYFVTQDTGNKVSRRSQIHGTQNIILGGRTVIQAEVCIRGDLVRSVPSTSGAASLDPSTAATNTAAGAKPPQHTSIMIGRYSFISTGSILRPPSKLHRGGFSYHPLKIGENVFVGPGCVIEAAQLGNNVWIGRGAVLGKMCIVKDMVKILEGSVIPPGMVVASGSVIGGRPARCVGLVGDGWEGFDGRELWRRTG